MSSPPPTCSSLIFLPPDFYSPSPPPIPPMTLSQSPPLLSRLSLFPQTPNHPHNPHSLSPHSTPQPHSYPPPVPPEGSRFAPAQTLLMPVVPRHAQANTRPPQRAPVAMATAKHGSLITLPSAHRVDNPCMPTAHSLGCPLSSAPNAMLSLSTSQIYNQYEACPLQ